MVIRRIKSKHSLWHRIIRILLLSLPFWTVVIAIIGSESWFKDVRSAGLSPLLAIPVIYYWRSNRPLQLPLWSIVILSLLQDTVSGTLLGLHFFIYIQVFLFTQTKFIWQFGGVFWVAWLWFSVVCAFCYISDYLIHFLVIYKAQILLNPMLGLGSFFATYLSYPIIAWLLTAIDRYFSPKIR